MRSCVSREKAVPKGAVRYRRSGRLLSRPPFFGSSPQQTKDREMRWSPPSRLFRTAAPARQGGTSSQNAGCSRGSSSTRHRVLVPRTNFESHLPDTTPLLRESGGLVHEVTLPILASSARTRLAVRVFLLSSERRYQGV